MIERATKVLSLFAAAALTIGSIYLILDIAKQSKIKKEKNKRSEDIDKQYSDILNKVEKGYLDLYISRDHLCYNKKQPVKIEKNGNTNRTRRKNSKQT